MDEAFGRLRDDARSHHLKLGDVDRDIVEGSRDPQALLTRPGPVSAGRLTRPVRFVPVTRTAWPACGPRRGPGRES
jgi:hypothetical protein